MTDAIARCLAKGDVQLKTRTCSLVTSLGVGRQRGLADLDEEVMQRRAILARAGQCFSKKAAQLKR